jgi:hypothetical protein
VRDNLLKEGFIFRSVSAVEFAPAKESAFSAVNERSKSNWESASVLENGHENVFRPSMFPVYSSPNVRRAVWSSAINDCLYKVSRESLVKLLVFANERVEPGDKWASSGASAGSLVVVLLISSNFDLLSGDFSGDLSDACRFFERMYWHSLLCLCSIKSAKALYSGKGYALGN